MSSIMTKYKHSKNAFKTVLGRSEAEKNSFLVLWMSLIWTSLIVAYMDVAYTDCYVNSYINYVG